MSKTWFRFIRPPQPQVAAPTTPTKEQVASAEEEIAEATSAGEAGPAEEITSAGAEEQVAPAEEITSAGEEVAPTEEMAAEEPLVAEVSAPASSPSVERIALALGTGQPIPSYVDAQSAGDWLAMLSQISAVAAYKTLSYDLLDLQPGERAADIGCGLGHDARELAKRVGLAGSVVGIDGSAEMIARATEATDAEAARTLRFIAADATALPLETSSCDALRADRLLQHVEDPLQALVEFRRVLRPGARIVIIEPDWKTMAVYPGSAAGGDDDRCVAAIFDWQVAHTRHPLMGRQLRMLLTQAGFVSVSVAPVAYASTRFIEADLTLELSRAAAGAAEQWPARLSAAEVSAWRVTAQAADTAGHFFASVPLFFAHAIVE
jgi:ubiquinone/menaquinone biosynthesis C-methylase UbiE